MAGLVDRINERHRRAAEQRTIGGLPWRPYVPFGSGGPARPTQQYAGEEASLRLAPLYSAVRLLADGVASLPLKIYRDTGPDGPQLWTGPSLFDQPAPHGTLYDWLFACMSSLLLHGNALGFIAARDGFGFPTSIVWLPYERCWIHDEETADFLNPVRPRFYFAGREIPQENLVHIKAFALAGKTAGVSPLRAFRLLIQAGHNQTRYSHDWFEHGGFPPGTFKNAEEQVDKTQAREIRQDLTEAIILRQPLVYGRDWDYTPIKVPPEEAQFVETSRLTATHFAGIYGVPPERIGGSRGDSLTYSTQEQGTNDMITWALRPWLVRLEQAFFPLLPAIRRVKFDADDMIRTDVETKHKIYEIDRRIGYRTNDEMRKVDDLPPLDAGVGAEKLPLDVLVAMARGMLATPRTFESELTQAAAPNIRPPAGVEPGSTGVAPAAAPLAQPGIAGSAKPPLAVQPMGMAAPAGRGELWEDGPHYSVAEIARACFGHAGDTPQYLDHIAGIARTAGYTVLANSAEQFSKAQSEWIATEALTRPGPQRRVTDPLDGHEAVRRSRARQLAIMANGHGS